MWFTLDLLILFSLKLSGKAGKLDNLFHGMPYS